MGYVPGISASCNGPIINHMPARRLPKDAVFKGFWIQVPENGFIYLDCHSAHNSPFVPLCKNTTFAEIMLRNECKSIADGSRWQRRIYGMADNRLIDSELAHRTGLKITPSIKPTHTKSGI